MNHIFPFTSLSSRKPPSSPPHPIPAYPGIWILPKIQSLHPSLMRDRFRGDLTRWVDALTPRLLALWEAEDRKRLEENRYMGWTAKSLPETLLYQGYVLLRGHAILREGRIGQPTPPPAIHIHFIHRLLFVSTPQGIRLDALDEAEWHDWQSAQMAVSSS